MVFFLALWSEAAFAQGFAGLGTRSDGFDIPIEGHVLSFPADHAAHPAFRIEWWYLTANLLGEDGKDYGLQWTLFRSALSTEQGVGWNTPQLWMGHAAVTTPTQHLFAERLARGGIGQAGVRPDPFDAWIDDWSLSSTDATFNNMTLIARGPEFSYAMALRAQGPLVLHGDQGYSVKSQQGQASYYYSQPFFDIDGTLILPNGPLQVTGSAWLDREWSSQPLASDQTGWDWFSLTFDSGEKLMAFRLRGDTDYTSGTWILPDGQTTPLRNGAINLTQLRQKNVAERNVPVEWRLQVADYAVDVDVKAVNDHAWMGTSVPYWEGPVRVTGSHSGTGYLEMTGYE
jgi:predicted secreted hydrolase